MVHETRILKWKGNQMCLPHASVFTAKHRAIYNGVNGQLTYGFDFIRIGRTLDLLKYKNSLFGKRGEVDHAQPNKQSASWWGGPVAVMTLPRDSVPTTPDTVTLTVYFGSSWTPNCRLDKDIIRWSLSLYYTTTTTTITTTTTTSTSLFD